MNRIWIGKDKTALIPTRRGHERGDETRHLRTRAEKKTDRIEATATQRRVKLRTKKKLKRLARKKGMSS